MKKIDFLKSALSFVFIIFLFAISKKSVFPSLLILTIVFFIYDKDIIIKFLTKSWFLIFLIPLSFLNFIFIQDSLWRLNVLFIALILTLFYIILSSNTKIEEKNLKIKLIVLIGVVLFSTLVSYNKKIYFSGDEPHYLVLANSIYYDHDINIVNNHSHERTKHFWKSKRPLPYHGFYGKKGKKYVYSFHFPGISVLILPFFVLGESFFNETFYFFIIRLGVIFWALLAALQFFKFLKNLKIKPRDSFFIVFLSFTLTPLIFYSTHLFPAIFLMFFMLYAINNLFFEKKNYLKTSISLSIMVWLGLKATIIIGGIGIALLIKEKLKLFKVKTILSFSPLFLSYTALFYWIYSAYGSFSLFSIYNGPLTPEKKKYLYELILYKIPLSLRIDSFLNYFFDQRDGLFPYFPVLFLFIPALAYIIKGKIKQKQLYLLFIPFGLFVFNYAFNTHRGGYCPPARPLAPFVWLISLSIYYYIKEKNKDRFFKLLLSVLVSITLFIVVVLTIYPTLMYQTTTHEVFERSSSLSLFSSNSILYLPNLLPSFLKHYNWSHKANYFWIILSLLILITSLMKNRKKIRNAFLKFTLFTFGFIFILYLTFPFYSIKKYKKIITINKKVFLPKTFGNIKLEKNYLLIFNSGRRFLPVYTNRKYPYLNIKIFCLNEQNLSLKNDIKTIFSIKCKKDKELNFTLKMKKLNKNNNFLPLFINNNVLETKNNNHESLKLYLKPLKSNQ